MMSEEQPTGGSRIYDAVQSERFGHVIMAVIVLAGVLVGLETSMYVMEHYGQVLRVFDKVIVSIFAVEVLMKLWTGFHYAEDGERRVMRPPQGRTVSRRVRHRWRRFRKRRRRRVKRFFKEPWNVFDFLIVVAALLPIVGSGAVFLRLARIFRILRLIRIIPTLPQAHVATVWSARRAFVYIMFLMGLLFYMYAVAGVFLFRENDPVHFGDVYTALLSLFRVVTLEDWTDVMYTQMHGCDVFGFGTMEHLCTSPNAMPFISPIFFVSFIMFGTMIFLNMFVGIIVTAMDDATRTARENEIREALRKVLAELRTPEAEDLDLSSEISALDAQLALVEERVRSLRRVTGHMTKKYGVPGLEEDSVVEEEA